MKYTVIIPHYNDKLRLQRLINSIPLDHRTDIEIIVIDDCSPQENYLKELKDKYKNIIWKKTEINSGAGVARNIGLHYTSGEYLLFADSDDEFTFDCFDKLDINLNSSDDLFYFLSEAVIEGSSKASNRADFYNQLCLNYLNEKSQENEQKLRMEHMIPVAKVYRSKKIKQLGIQFQNTKYSNDIFFNVIAALEIEKIKVIDEIIYKIYRRNSSMTSNLGKEQFLIRLNTIINLANKIKKYDLKFKYSGTGYLVQSLKFGPLFFLYTLKKIAQSDLDINFVKIFSIKRWKKFISTKLNEKKEIRITRKND